MRKEVHKEHEDHVVGPMKDNGEVGCSGSFLVEGVVDQIVCRGGCVHSVLYL